MLKNNISKKITISSITILLVTLATVGCSTSDITNNYDAFSKANNTIIAINKDNEIIPTVEDLDEWLGEYHYYEFLSPDIMFDIRMNIYKEKGNYYGRVEINGFQVWEDFTAIATGGQDEIVFTYLINNLNGSNTKRYEGDIVFSLRMSEEKLLTDWGTIEPNGYDNQISGEVRFYKVVK